MSEILVRLRHDVPLVWAEPGGREWLCSTPVETPVFLRGVDAGAMTLKGNEDGRPRAEFEGRVWFPFKRNGLDEWCSPRQFVEYAEAVPPFELSIRFSAPLIRGNAGYPAPDRALARSVCHPEAESRAWATRFVADGLVHDGSRVWLCDPVAAIDGRRPNTRALEAATFRNTMTQDGTRLLENVAAVPRTPADPARDAAAAVLRRLLVRAHVDAIGIEARPTALLALKAVADSLLQANGKESAWRHACQVRRHVEIALSRTAGEVVLPEEDADAIDALAP